MIRVRDMDALTLTALAEELERDARFFRKDELWHAYASALEHRAAVYRRRARMATGGWQVAKALKEEVSRE